MWIGYVGIGFVIGGVVGIVIAALFASTRLADVEAERDELENKLTRLRARCQREYGQKWAGRNMADDAAAPVSRMTW